MILSIIHYLPLILLIFNVTYLYRCFYSLSICFYLLLSGCVLDFVGILISHRLGHDES